MSLIAKLRTLQPICPAQPITPQTPREFGIFQGTQRCFQSLSLPGPAASSSSSLTTSSPAVIASSAFCNVRLSSVLRGSTSSIGRNFALFRILLQLAPRLYCRSKAITHLGSHPASNRISTTAFPDSDCSLLNRTALCKHVSPSLFSLPSISTPSWSSIISKTS